MKSNLGNGKTKVLYEKWKENNDLHEKIIPGFNNVIQTQLITSRGKPHTYYATSNTNNKKYVLKGPMTIYMSKTSNENRKIKVLGLNHLNVEFINLFDQNWMKMDSLLDYDYNSKELKSSKLEVKCIYL